MESCRMGIFSICSIAQLASQPASQTWGPDSQAWGPVSKIWGTASNPAKPQASGMADWASGLAGWFIDLAGWPRGGDMWTENLPILQDFIPYCIRAAALLPPMKTRKISFKNKSRAGHRNRWPFEAFRLLITSLSCGNGGHENTLSFINIPFFGTEAQCA